MKKEKASVDIAAAEIARKATVEKLIEAVRQELKGEFIQRHKVNILSPSFPYDYRTLANCDCLGTGPAETLMCGGRMLYAKDSLLAWLRARLGLGEE